MDKSNWEDTFNNKMELDASCGLQGVESFDVNEIADDMFRINDDKLIGMVGDDFLTQFGLDDAFNSELFSTDIPYTNNSFTLGKKTFEAKKEECKIFCMNKLNVSGLDFDNLQKNKKLKIHKEIKSENISPVLVQDQNTKTHSAIIVPINTLTTNPSIAQIPQGNAPVNQELKSTLVQPASQIVAIQSLPTVMYNYTEANGTIKSQVCLINI